MWTSLAAVRTLCTEQDGSLSLLAIPIPKYSVCVMVSSLLALDVTQKPLAEFAGFLMVPNWTHGFRLYKWCRVRGRVFVLFPFYFWGQRPREAVIYPGSHRILVGESGLTARFSDLLTLLPCLLAVAWPCVVLWPCTSILSPVQLSWPWSTSPSLGQWWCAIGFLDLKMIITPSSISMKGYFIKITETFFPLKPE